MNLKKKNDCVINDTHVTDTMSLEYENDHLRFLFLFF